MMLAVKDKRKRLFFYFIIFLFVSTINFYDPKDKKKKVFFPINNIEIVGIKKINKDKIFDTLSIFYGQSIFDVNEKEIGKILADFVLIKNFEVKRNYPNKIKFIINESKFIGILIKNKKKYFLTDNEKIYLFNEDLNEKGLPIIYGKNAQKYFKAFNISLKKNKFDINLIKNYYFFQSNRWDLILNNDLIIKFPITNMNEAIKLINRLLKDPSFKNLKIIDLRINNRVITTS